MFARYLFIRKRIILFLHLIFKLFLEKKCSLQGTYLIVAMIVDIMESMKTIRVVAAILEKEGKILIARRLHGEQKDLWEFPGGKYEERETGEEAIRREIEEEFDAKIEVRKLLCTVEHQYDSFYLIMDCYICAFKTENIHLHDHSAIRWIDPKEEGIEWVPADRKVIKKYLESRR